MNINRTETLDRIALTVRKWRIENYLTQRELEDLSGVSCSTISRVERGHWVRLASLMRIVGVLATYDLLLRPRPDNDPVLFPAEWAS